MKAMHALPMLAMLQAAALLAACESRRDPPPDAAASTQPIRLDDERARASYMVGLDVAGDLQPIRDEIDLDIVTQSMRAALSGAKPQLDAAQLEQVRHRFTAQLREKRARQARELAKRNLEAGERFLAGNARKPGVVTRPSGLQYLVLREGSGPRPPAGGTVSIDYVGRTLDGREFSNTRAAQHPETVPLSRVMPGLAEGLALMRQGGRYRFWIPGNLAYGEAGKAGEIEPNATLVLDIELLGIAPGPAR